MNQGRTKFKPYDVKTAALATRQSAVSTYLLLALLAVGITVAVFYQHNVWQHPAANGVPMHPAWLLVIGILLMLFIYGHHALMEYRVRTRRFGTWALERLYVEKLLRRGYG